MGTMPPVVHEQTSRGRGAPVAPLSTAWPLRPAETHRMQTHPVRRARSHASRQLAHAGAAHHTSPTRRRRAASSPSAAGRSGPLPSPPERSRAERRRRSGEGQARAAKRARIGGGHPGTNERTQYLHHDLLGSIEAISDETGLVHSQQFDPYGTPDTPGWTVTGILSGFTGHEHDPDLGLINMQGRLYDPAIGRFISADPYVQYPGWSQGLNRYSYGFNNPMSGSDPTGFSWLSDIFSGDTSSGWQDSTFFGAALGVVGGAYATMLYQSGAFGEGAALHGFSGNSGIGGGIAIGEAINGLNDPGANETYAAPTGELGSGASQGELYNENAGASPSRPHGAMACYPASACGPQTRTLEGITFEQDDQGRLILTKEILDEVMKDVFTNSLSGHSRWAGLQTVNDVMKVLDTPFFLMSRQGGDTFVVGGLLEFTAEEVNYVGVGMGMTHFHLLRLAPTPWIVGGWNAVKYGHGPTVGELLWANFGRHGYTRLFW